MVVRRFPARRHAVTLTVAFLGVLPMESQSLDLSRLLPTFANGQATVVIGYCAPRCVIECRFKMAWSDYRTCKVLYPSSTD